MDMTAIRWCLAIVVIYFFATENDVSRSFNVYAASMERIVGGSDAKIEDFQHQLSMEMMFMHSCGASILSKTWAVTAAHCVMSLPNPPPWYVRLRAGSTSGFLGGIVGGQIHKISQALPHPGFNKSTTDYDVALLQVTPPFTYSAKVGPIDLPAEGDEFKPGQVGTVSGWGMKSERALFTPWILQSVSLRVVDRAECARNYTAVKGMVSPRMICAGGFGDGKDSCQGDSGGPFISHDRKLVGIVSWGYGCARSGFPGVYTNIAHPDIRSFIRNFTGL